jgi:hypothetical protein
MLAPELFLVLPTPACTRKHGCPEHLIPTLQAIERKEILEYVLYMTLS